MHFQSSDSKMLQQQGRPSQNLTTPTNLTAVKTFTVKEFSDSKSLDPKFALNKKNSLETASSGSSNSTTSCMSNGIKNDFLSKEKNYQLTIEKLQKKIESLTLENKKLTTESTPSTKNSTVFSGDAFEEKSSFLRKIDKLTEENSVLQESLTTKNTEIQTLEKKLGLFEEQRQKTEGLNALLAQLKSENQGLIQKMGEKEKKYEELEENYKQKLSQFKREIVTIKTQQKETSQKDITETIGPLNARIRDLEDLLRKKTEDIQDLTNRLHRKSTSNLNRDKDDPKTPTPMPMASTRFGSYRASEASMPNSAKLGPLIKHNWDEFERKINNLIEENDKLSENGENYWRKRCQDLEERMKDLEQGKNNEIVQKSRGENEELKRTVLQLSAENQNLMRRLSEIQGTKEEELRRKEEELKIGFEQTFTRLEEQKEKNLMKISKENHELKQHNDELKQMVENLQKQRLNSTSNNSSNSSLSDASKKAEKEKEKTPLTQNSSPILIINEMLTPSAKNLLDKNPNFHKENPGKTLPTVVEVAKDENVFNFTKNKKNSNENVKKTYFSTSNLAPNNVITLQSVPNETLKPLNKPHHNSRESQEFQSNKFLSKNYGVYSSVNGQSTKENNNNSSKEVSFKENNLKDSNMSFENAKNEGKTENGANKTNEKFDFLSNKTDFKQGNYLQNVRNESKKETKVISFNLLDNKLKGETSSALNSNRFAKV